MKAFSFAGPGPRLKLPFKVMATSALALGLTASAVMARDLVIAFPADQEPQNLDYQVDPYTSARLLDTLMTDTLVVVAPDGSYQPDLAKSWDASPDARSFTMHLTPGVKFQDGTPFNAAAVVYNVERTLDPATASGQLASEIGPLKSVKAVDDMTVTFTYDKPWTSFLHAISEMPVWSPTAAKASTPQDFDKKLVGTGQFELKDWVANDHIDMTRWDGYGGWNSQQTHEGPAGVEGVRIRFIGEPSILGAMVENGEADIGYMVPALSLQDYENNPDYTVLSKGQSGTGLQMVMNTARPPLNQLKVRQALLYGRNMKQANMVLYDGLYGESDGPLNNISPCYWKGAGDMYPYDPKKAAQLLDEAGWVKGPGGMRVAKGVKGVADGTPLSLSWTVLHHAEIGEFVQAQLKQIGVDLKVVTVPGPVQLERVTKRDFDLMYERIRASDPSILDMIWNPAYTKPGQWSWTGFEDPDLTSQLDIIRTDPDNDKRCEAAKAAQKIIMQNALTFPTLTQPTFVVTSSHVKGFKMGAEGTSFFLNDVTLEK